MKNTKKILAVVFAAVLLGLFTGCFGNPLSGKTFEGKINVEPFLNLGVTYKFNRDTIDVSFNVGLISFLNVNTNPFSTSYKCEGSTISFLTTKDAKTVSTFNYELKEKKLTLYDDDGNTWAVLTQK